MNNTAPATHIKPGSEAKTIGVIVLVISFLILIYPFAMNVLVKQGIVENHNYASSVEGVVTQNIENNKRRSETFIVAYDVDGKTYTLDETFYPDAGQNELTIGQKLPVHYDPDKPSVSTLNANAPVENTEVRQASAGFFAVFGIAFLIFGFYSSSKSKRIDREKFLDN